MRSVSAGLLLACFVCSSALAQDAAPPVDETLDEEARALFSAGNTAFNAGRFEDALGHFRRAYELSRRPGLLYNVGLAADRLRRDEEALAAFEQFLAELPEHENRAQVEARVRALRAVLARSESHETTGAAEGASAGSIDDPRPVEEPADEGDLLDNVGAPVTIGLGVAGIATAIALLVARNDAVAERNAICVALPITEDCAINADVMAAHDRATTLDSASTAMWIVGGALAALGVAWLIVDLATEEPAEAGPSAALAISPTGAALVGRF